MFIRITRLLLIIIASIFLGMCIVWWFMYIAKDESTLMLRVAMFGAVVLILAILGLQFWENRKARKEREKLIKEQEKLIKEQEKTDKNRV
ncbi:MAG: hypothetical protein LBT27_01320 [Prevotellaceae bacterium]|nr:hypothetical protein [Prevotellaceae bacterium]